MSAELVGGLERFRFQYVTPHAHGRHFMSATAATKPIFFNNLIPADQPHVLRRVSPGTAGYPSIVKTSKDTSTSTQIVAYVAVPLAVHEVQCIAAYLALTAPENANTGFARNLAHVTL